MDADTFAYHRSGGSQALTQPGQGWIVSCKSSWQEDSQLRCDAPPLRRGRSADSPRACSLPSLCSTQPYLRRWRTSASRFIRQRRVPAWRLEAGRAVILPGGDPRIIAIASRRFARHSSRVLPWPFAPGTSAQYATYQGPPCSTIAVNSLRIQPFYAAHGKSSEPILRSVPSALQPRRRFRCRSKVRIHTGAGADGRHPIRSCACRR